jgi:hypothetical protein
LLVLAGSGMQGYASGTVAALFVGVFFLLAGCGLVIVAFRARHPELLAFVLTYGTCLVAGGLTQCYSLRISLDPQDFADAIFFFEQISLRPPFTPLADMLSAYVVATGTWQALYKATWWLGLPAGPYTGVMFNAFLVGVSGSLTVGTARTLFGHDPWRLRRVAVLFAFCGLSLLFGGLLLRDCFALLFTGLWLWAAVRLLAKPSALRIATGAVVAGVSTYTLQFLRAETVMLFGLHAVILSGFWFFTKRLTIGRVAVASLVLCALMIAGPYVVDYAMNVQRTLTESAGIYATLSATEAGRDSLGMQFIVNQPLPIRLVGGAGTLLASPIPLWTNFRVGAMSYLWLKGYSGVYHVLVLPLCIAGIVAAARLSLKDGPRAFPLLFVAVFWLVSLLAVVASSGEQRHLGQFMPAFMILAGLPDTRQARERSQVRWIAVPWYAAVVLAHVAWAVMKGVI